MAGEKSFSAEDLKSMTPEERMRALQIIQNERRQEIEERQRQLEEEISETERLLSQTQEEIDEDVIEQTQEQLEELLEEQDDLEGLIEEEGLEERSEGQVEQEARLYHGRETGYSNKERLEYHVGGGGRMRPGENIHFHRSEGSMQDMYRRREGGGGANYQRNEGGSRNTKMSDVYSPQDRSGTQQDYKTGEQTMSGSNLSSNILREMYRH